MTGPRPPRFRWFYLGALGVLVLAFIGNLQSQAQQFDDAGVPYTVNSAAIMSALITIAVGALLWGGLVWLITSAVWHRRHRNDSSLESPVADEANG